LIWKKSDIDITKKLKFCNLKQQTKKKDVCYSRRRRAPFRARSLFLRDSRIVAIVRVFVHFYSLFFD